MQTIKTLIIEDEKLARRELRLLLQAHRTIEVVGEAISPAEALELAGRLAPGLLFLDVHLRGGSGFDVLKGLKEPRPRIIFTTAHADFALQAFDFDAVDYLLKPVHPARLARAVEKLDAEPDVLPASDMPLRRDSRVLLKDGENCRFVPLCEVSLIESEGNYSRIHADGATHLVHKSLSAVEARLPVELFFRANRSQIVNLEAIRGIEPWFSNTLRATLSGGAVIEFSRRASLEFRESRAL